MENDTTILIHSSNSSPPSSPKSTSTTTTTTTTSQQQQPQRKQRRKLPIHPETHERNNHYHRTPPPPSGTVSTSSSSSTTGIGVVGGVGGEGDIQSGGWKWSEPRRIAFWVKNSVRNVVTPDLSCVYESDSCSNRPPRPLPLKLPLPSRRSKPKPTAPSHSENNNHTTTTPRPKGILHTLHDTYNINLFSGETSLADLTVTDDTYTSSKKRGTKREKKVEKETTGDNEVEEEDEEPYSFPPCRTIDQAMSSLHTLQCYPWPNTILPSSMTETAKNENEEVEEGEGEENEEFRPLDYRTLPCYQNYYSFSPTIHPPSSSLIGSGAAVTTIPDLPYDWILDGDLVPSPLKEGGSSSRRSRTPSPQRRGSLRFLNGHDALSGKDELEKEEGEEGDETLNAEHKENEDNEELLAHVLETMELERSLDGRLSSSSSSEEEEEGSFPSSSFLRTNFATYEDEEEETNDIPKNLIMNNNNNHTNNNNSLTTNLDLREWFPNPWEPTWNNKEVCVCGTGIPSQRPMADVGCPEGSFVRRLRLEEEEKQNEGEGCVHDTKKKEESEREEKEEGLYREDDAGVCDEGEDDTISPLYYTENYDPLLDILKSVPWDAPISPPSSSPLLSSHTSSSSTPDSTTPTIPLHQSENILRIDAHLSHTLSTLDVAYQRISRTLVSRISQHRSDVEDGMKRIREADADIADALSSAKIAGMYLQRARGREARLFRSGSPSRRGCGVLVGRRNVVGSGGRGGGIGGGGPGSGILGGNYVVELADSRERLKELDKVLQECESVWELDRRVEAFGSGGSGIMGKEKEFRDLVKVCFGWKDRMEGRKEGTTKKNNEDDDDDRFILERLTCFDALKERIHRATTTLQRQLDASVTSFVSKLCDRRDDVRSTKKGTEEWDLEYHTLLDAYYTLHPVEFAASNLGRSVTNALRFEVDRCLARALLDPTPDYVVASQTSDSRRPPPSSCPSSDFDHNLSEISRKIASIRADDEDAASLRALTQNLMVIRFQFETSKNYLPRVYHRLCVCIADVLHTHFLLSGCVTPDADEVEAKDETYFTDSTTTTSTTITTTTTTTTTVEASSSFPTTTNTNNQTGEILDQRRSAISHEIHSSRLELWRRCEHVLTYFLETSGAFSSAVASPPSSPKRTNGGGCGEGGGAYDDAEVEHFCDVLHLSNQMTVLAREFLGSEVCRAEGIVLLLSSNGDNDDEEDEDGYDGGLNCSSIISTSTTSSTSNCTIKDTIQNVLQCKLRQIHTEAMTEMGNMLANESWQAIPYPLNDTSVHSRSSSETVTTSTEEVRQCVERMLVEYSPVVNEDVVRTWHNRFYYQHYGSDGETTFFPTFSLEGNPFLSIDINAHIPVEEPVLTHSSSDSTSSFCNELYDKVASCIDIDAVKLTVATKSALHIVRWTSRLFAFSEKLPLVREDVARVVCNLYDLYYLTVFRLCMGSRDNERIVLGLEERNNDLFPLQNLPCVPPGPNRRRISPQRSVSANLPVKAQHSYPRRPYDRRSSNGSVDSLSSSTHSLTDQQRMYHNLQHVEADIYFPLRSENESIDRVRVFIERGQASLSEICDLDKIEGWSPNTMPHTGTGNGENAYDKETMHEALVMQKRIIASFSCLFVSCVFDTALTRLEMGQSSPAFARLFGVGVVVEGSGRNPELDVYRKQLKDASGYVHLLCLRMCTVRAIKGEQVVRRILSIGNGWSAATLNESSHDYVDALSKRCTLLWGHMSLHSTFLTQESMLLQTWDHIIESSFLSILEGFSRVCCSTEGRASMSIDLATYCASVNGRVMEERLGEYFKCVGRLPPPSAPRRGMQYVDMYVKVFYFPEDDVMKWIIENRHLYQLSHLLALVSFGMINPLSQSLLCEQVKTL